jgi:hypothetical protein
MIENLISDSRTGSYNIRYTTEGKVNFKLLK